MKGIILAGGTGTRMWPMTKRVSKQLLPVYDKPMVFYPLATLMMLGIRDILVITTPHDMPAMRYLLGDGSELGIRLSYKEQPSPDGIAQSFIIGEEFIGEDPVSLILGDNIFYGHDLSQILKPCTEINKGAYIVSYRVTDPERYGVVEIDKNYQPLSIEEKPKNPKSNWAITGLYFYDKDVVKIAKALKPSGRGELEITDVNKAYLEQGTLRAKFLSRGFAWLDTGTPDSLLAAATFIQTVEARQGLKICCIEEIAYNKGYIDKVGLKKLAESYGKSAYGGYLKKIIDENSA